MLTILREFVEKIETADILSIEIMPLKLVEVFDFYYRPEVGRLVRQLWQANINLKDGVIPVVDAAHAFQLVKSSNNESEKLYYALILLGEFNPAARPGIHRFMEAL